VGVDTGGTFTDLVALEEGGAPRARKLASTPDDPSRALFEGLADLVPARAGRASHELVHGTTVALNALLTGRVARAALVTNAGFADLIEIGRQDRPDIYALHPVKPEPLVPRERRFEVAQRSWPAHGGARDAAAGPRIVEVARPDSAELERLRRAVAASGAESVAICLLHAYADPAIERAVAEALAPLGLPITCSAELLPVYREVERFSTATVNAALVPVLSRYLERLAQGLGGARLSILQSSGGTLPAERAALEPVRVLFSGPAGGVVGAGRAAAECGLEAVVTLDMGGTSTDVAFHDPRLAAGPPASDLRVAGHPIAVPSLDLHTIGCGGGSIVRVDAGGILHVGPDSAGADPGPVAYGRGEEPTVTDAHVALGHIAAEGFLDGRLPLDVDAVARAFERLAARLGVRPVEAAQGVLDVARAAMRRALGVMTMQRGKDPRALPLVAFGGGGGLHALPLARSLAMPGALVPALPGVLSAFGMARADALRDHATSVLEPLGAWSARRRAGVLATLARAGRDELRAAGLPASRIEVETSLDLRYRGQSYELAVPEGPAVAELFAARHRERYGFDLEGREVELVTLRARAIARTPPPAPGPPARSRPAPGTARVGERRAWFGAWIVCPRFDRSALPPGAGIEGPAIVEEFSGTTLVPPGALARVRGGGHLWLSDPGRVH